jgi:tetratricopeptide (TPR) repeat protein
LEDRIDGKDKMMKKAFLLIVCLSLAAAFLSAQDYKGKGRVGGLVVDQDDKPIEGVKVKLFLEKANGGFEVATNKDGKWTAPWMASGSWNVDFEKLGYGPKKIQVDIVEQRKNPEVKITMKKLEGLVVTDDLRALLDKANLLYDQKDYKGAMEAYLAMLTIFPDAYFLWRNIGNVHFVQEKYDLAEEAYKKILDKDPANVEAVLSIGNCYANRGRTDQALEWYNKIQFDKINDATVLFNIGTNYYNLAKFEDALKYYQRSIEVKKDYLDGLYQLGLTYTNLQKTTEAVAAFEQYLKIDADSPRSAQVKGFLDYLKKK